LWVKKGFRIFIYLVVIIGVAVLAMFLLSGHAAYYPADADEATTTPVVTPPKPTLDKHAYDAKLLKLAHITVDASSTVEATLASSTAPWPVKTVYPNAGALLPFNRIVAYYGNFLSPSMGILGQYPEDLVLEKLKATVAEWEAADPSTPVIPAIHYIDVTAQGSPGADGKYRLRMPDTEIDHALQMAA
jgi:hypothetical protein